MLKWRTFWPRSTAAIQNEGLLPASGRFSRRWSAGLVAGVLLLAAACTTSDEIHESSVPGRVMTPSAFAESTVQGRAVVLSGSHIGGFLVTDPYAANGSDN